MTENTTGDTRGLYGKFTVARTDGKSAPGAKHHGCRYYVLDLDHDPHALPALRAYAESARIDHPALARDLDRLADDVDYNREAMRADDEQCTYCEGWFPRPVYLHHAEIDCVPSTSDSREVEG